MANDPNFRMEMQNRQAAFLANIEQKQRDAQARLFAAIQRQNTQKDDILPPEDIVSSNGCCSLQFIQRATISQLKKAVKAKRLSAARFRIELRRRKDKEYYNNMPETIYG